MEQGDYINNLLDADDVELKDPGDIKLFHRLCQAKSEGDAAANTISQLRMEIERLVVLVNNRQGRFDALSNLLYEAKMEAEIKPDETESEATSTPAEELPPAPVDILPLEDPPSEPTLSENN